MSRTALHTLLFAVFPIALSATCAAQGDPVAGERLAERWCAQCHAIKPGQPSPGKAAPTFPAVAAERSVTDYSLRVFLRVPHATMPNLILKPDEIDDIVSYLMSLKPTP
jgi:mono/diheme cytochrome c family protein